MRVHVCVCLCVRVRVCVHTCVCFYKFIGPWFEPRSYIKEEVKAGFRASTDGENYVGWTDEYFSGLDMRLGLDLDFGILGEVSVFESDIFNVVDVRL